MQFSWPYPFVWQAISTLGKFLTSEQAFEVELLVEVYYIFRWTLGLTIFIVLSPYLAPRSCR